MTEDWDALVRAVVDAWQTLPAGRKAALMAAHPDLYWACARLCEHGRFTFNLD